MQAGRRHFEILRLHRRFAGDRKGAVAVEFALVAFPLVFMLMACFELAMIIVLSVTLDHATDVSARQIRTGILLLFESADLDDAFRALVEETQDLVVDPIDLFPVIGKVTGHEWDPLHPCPMSWTSVQRQERV